MKSIIISFISGLTILFSCECYSQGCIAIRSTGSSCSMHLPHADSSRWQFNANYRYFRSFRHFVGKEEQKQRQEQGTEVINHSHSLDLSLTRKLNERWSMSLNMPLLANQRSSLYEHGLVNGVYVKKERGTTESYGLGDMRLSAHYWLLNPEKFMKGNVQIGMGVKFATGCYDYQDYWSNVGPGGSDELRTVDQSIQLGDGGTGLTTELNGYFQITKRLRTYATAYYLINPRNVNGVRTYRETLSSSLYNEAISSVPDQYFGRLGVNYVAGKFSFALGGRIEGIPVYDLVGGSEGFRRPGYIIAVEPGINFTAKKVDWYLAVPVAISRNRTQSVTDKERSTASGTFQQGDAAFADYVINLGMSFRF
ncbi:MAG: hypothetical protein ABJA78_13935 [Ferruginibacter sp.]